MCVFLCIIQGDSITKEKKMNLLPCPMCGSSAILRTGIFGGQGGGKTAWVECSDLNCGCRTKTVDEWKDVDCEEDATQKWNRRFKKSE